MTINKYHQKTFRYRLNPTPEQERFFVQWAGCRRFVWNFALERRRQHFQETGTSLSFASLCSELTALKKLLPWLKEADSQALQQVLKDLDTAYKNFFEKRAGFPKRKKKFKTPNAFRIPQRVVVQGLGEDGKPSGAARQPNGFCRVLKIGLVPMILHRPLEGSVKSATFKQEASGHWFVTFVTEQQRQELPQACESPSPAGLSLFILPNGCWHRHQAGVVSRHQRRREGRAASVLSPAAGQGQARQSSPSAKREGFAEQA